jgi:outer membrane protein assembly factor BamB
MKRNKVAENASYLFDEIAVWRTRLPKVEFAALPASNNRPNPLVTEDMVYASVFSPGAVIALDRQTGKLIWRRDILKFGGSAVHLSQGKLLAQTANTVHALEPETGNTIWSFSPYGNSGETLYSQPTIYGDSVFVGDRHGFLHCLDSQSGKTRWKTATSKAKNRSVNSTPLVLNGLAIVGTNAKKAAAYATKTGKQVWATKLDGPSGFGPLLCRNLLAIVTDSIYLLKPENGKIVRRFSWNAYGIRQAEWTQREIVVSLSGNLPSDGNPKIVGLNESGIRFTETCGAFVEGIHFATETKLVYVSHFDGIEVRRRGTGVLVFKIERKNSAGGNGPVDVRYNTIYVLTMDGYVYALRHPLAQTNQTATRPK